MKEHAEHEIKVDKLFMRGIAYDSLNSLDLRSDIENNNIFDAILRTSGYVGNRPSDLKDDEEHEDDTWAIDALTEDGMCVTAYLYTSEYEYEQDVDLLKEWE